MEAMTRPIRPESKPQETTALESKLNISNPLRYCHESARRWQSIYRDWEIQGINRTLDEHENQIKDIEQYFKPKGKR